MASFTSDFNQLILRLMTPVELDDACVVILTEAKRIFAAEQATIYLKNPKGMLECVFTTEGQESQQVLPKNHPISKAYLAEKLTVLKTSETVSIVIVSLTSSPDPLGVMVLKVNDISPEACEKMEFFGLISSLTLKNILLNAQAKSSLEAQNIFISMASHELKTPLTTISAYSQLLQKKVIEGKEVKSEWLEVLTQATVRMTRMINELLQVNKIKSGKMPYTFEVCSAAKIAEQAVADFKNLYPNNLIFYKNTFEHDRDGEVRGDFDKLVVAVSHLLNSAVRFSETDQPVEIVVGKLKNKVCIEVTDHGPGIKKHHLPHLFQEFYKTGERANDGLGLGLYISKRIIEAHRGQIKVESNQERGTSFCILIAPSK